jgi:hypothetical protein
MNSKERGTYYSLSGGVDYGIDAKWKGNMGMDK